MTKRRRRANFTATEKVGILREHLLEGVPVSELCERHRIQPSQFYTWQKQLFENGARAFERDLKDEQRRLEREVERLRARTQQKDEVIAEVTRELVLLKKEVGEP